MDEYAALKGLLALLLIGSLPVLFRIVTEFVNFMRMNEQQREERKKKKLLEKNEHLIWLYLSPEQQDEVLRRKGRAGWGEAMWPYFKDKPQRFWDALAMPSPPPEDVRRWAEKEIREGRIKFHDHSDIVRRDQNGLFVTIKVRERFPEISKRLPPQDVIQSQAKAIGDHVAQVAVETGTWRDREKFTQLWREVFGPRTSMPETTADLRLLAHEDPTAGLILIERMKELSGADPSAADTQQ